MTTQTTRPKGVLLVGSVPLADAETVFRTASTTLGDRLARLPDGETGDRSNWIGWQWQILADQPAVEVRHDSPAEYTGIPRLGLRADADPTSIQFGSLGYAQAAKDSFARFARLQAEGVIPAQTRFQVSLPTPLASIIGFVLPEAQEAIGKPYRERLLEELQEITEAIPHDKLAIQWDVACEVAVLEGVWPVYFSDPKETIIAELVEIGNRVPADVELGYHLCYGDAGHKHFKQPTDTRLLVELINGIAAGVERPITWFHLPVPRDRTDEAYFAPLRDLQIAPETELYLGLVHYSDGIEGTRQRIATAQRVIPEFGISTECGLGRRDPQTIQELLRQHAEVSSPVHV